MNFSKKSVLSAGIGISILLCLSIPLVMAGPSDSWFPQNQWIQQITGPSYQNTIQVTEDYAPDRLIVRYKPEAVKSQSGFMSVQAMANAEAGSRVVRDLSTSGAIGMQVVQVTGTSLSRAMEVYKTNPDVLYVEPDYRISLSPIEKTSTSAPVQAQGLRAAGTGWPNDPGYTQLWGLENTGQTPFYGKPGADIKAPLAWGATTGSSSVVIALIDTGVDYTHPDLSSNIWQNPGEYLNGADDDGNGYIDDIRGWNFVSKNNDPMDDNGHGTHCAGTMAAVGNNGIGVTGVTWNAKIMPLKFLDSKGSGYTSDAISAILYARQKGVPIISCSFSGPGESQALKEAIDSSSALFICAAGNAGANSDITPQYPAGYPSSQIISVAASTYQDTLASFSNYGVSSVDIAAPGVSIYSTTKSGGYSYLNGTSMAVPYVTGTAALLKARNPSISTAQMKSKILGSCDVLASLSGKVATGGRLNAAKALDVTIPTPSPTPTFTPVPTVTRTPTPSPSPTFTPVPTVTRTPTPSPSPTFTPVPTATRTPTPSPTFTPSPTQVPVPSCGVYKRDVQSGFLRQGQAAVYGYYIPVDGRSKIEWSLTVRGTCGAGQGIATAAKAGGLKDNNNACAGSSVFDLYVCRDCNPQNSRCYANYYAYGPNAYTSITKPASGSTYFVMIYATSGNGMYDLQMNSYKCAGNTPIIVASTEQGMQMAGTESGAYPSSIPVPSAEFVPV
ncbi:MAG TPA: S8 family serine peptidase [Methanospirillum sp.]|uniref:S8 family peptidase n=1 Tax=Methanospirillum sp. TaxID=45200 RepID=UPI002CBC6433|nr:S8 family serine peptidase [Methanospirillum sp.]HOJ97203.1 S8 family serine peptidase [Methanospirillum sp.]